MHEPERYSGRQPIKASLFWETFAAELRSVVVATARWPAIYDTNNHWTTVVMGSCGRTGNALGFWADRELYFEYMKIDCGFFMILPEEAGKHSCNWDWEVAIEYENNPTGWDWLEEFTRLAHLNAGLKVLITYFSFQSSDGDPCTLALNEAAKLYRQRKYTQQNDSWLFIFGPKHADLKRLARVDFRAFSWSGGDEFVELPSYDIIPSLNDDALRSTVE